MHEMWRLTDSGTVHLCMKFMMMERERDRYGAAAVNMASSRMNKSVCSDQRDVDNTQTVNTHLTLGNQKGPPNAISLKLY